MYFPSCYDDIETFENNKVAVFVYFLSNEKCYKLQYNDGTLLKLAEPGTYMQFENHKK